ncbi:MAG: deoxyribonuclease V [Synechocystis sp.]
MPSTALTAARLEQERLRHQVILQDCFSSLELVAGVDVAFADQGRWSKAAIVIMTYPDLHIVETAIAAIPTVFPYYSGFLSFRELPVILAAWEKLQHQPDVILCDGQGIAHPRRFGLACHLGVHLDVPTIGVAKSRLIGSYDPVPVEKGAWVPLQQNQDTIGIVLRSRTNVKPLFISVGHKVSLASARQIVVHCLGRYRLPEPTRQADKISKLPLAHFLPKLSESET